MNFTQTRRVFLLEIFYCAVNLYMEIWKTANGFQTDNYFSRKSPRLLHVKDTSKFVLAYLVLNRRQHKT